jgi:cytochrome c
MRNLGLTIAAATLAAALSGCGKSTSTNQAEQAPATSAGQAATASTTQAAEPTDEQKKAIVQKLPAPYNAGDLANGEAKFAICKSCHTLAPGGPDLTGPNLNGVLGRKVASKAGYNYSDALKAQSFTWDAAQMDKWLTDPKALVPGTKMTFVGFKEPKDRIDVIAYVAAETAAHP